MADQQFHVVALSPLDGGFFDPVSRINLSRTNPQGFIPVGSPISGSIRAMLLSGGLIDVSGTLLPLILAERAEAAKRAQAGFPRPPVHEGTTNQPDVQSQVIETPEVPAAEETLATLETPVLEEAPVIEEPAAVEPAPVVEETPESAPVVEAPAPAPKTAPKSKSRAK